MAEITTAIRSDVIAPAKFGMKPVDSSVKTLGKGPIEAPCTITKVRPRNTSMPASVTMKLGIFR